VALPRHLQIIYEINRQFLEEVKSRWPGDEARLKRMSLIEEEPERKVRMANLAIVGSRSVNGVAAIHSELVKKELVPDFYEMTPWKFNNKTNGVTPRRWYLVANPELSSLLTTLAGDGWVDNLDQLRSIEKYATDQSVLDKLRKVKHLNKERLARYTHSVTGMVFDPNAMMDIQIKRIHLYKRQLLMLLRVAWQYLRVVEDGHTPCTPRSCLLAGKAAPGYLAAVVHEQRPIGIDLLLPAELIPDFFKLALGVGAQGIAQLIGRSAQIFVAHGADQRTRIRTAAQNLVEDAAIQAERHGLDQVIRNQ
jgi:starch phosphorylase